MSHMAPKLVKIAWNMTFWALLNIFTSNKKWINFLVVILYGVFWKDMSHLMYFVGSVRGFWVAHMVLKLVKIAWNMSFWILFDHFHFKKIEMNPILWSILGEYEPFNILKCTSLVVWSPKIALNDQIYYFWAIFTHFKSTKAINGYIFCYY